MKRLLLPFSIVAVVSCTKPSRPPPGSAGPAEAVHDLSVALQKGDADTAWTLLSAQTQREADALAALARGAAGRDAGPASGREMLFSSALPLGSVEGKVVSQRGDEAQVQALLADGGTGRTYHVIREGGRWRVDLPLPRPSSPLPATGGDAGTAR